MRYLINILRSLYMIFESVCIGNSRSDVLKLIKFLSSEKQKSLTLVLIECDTNILVKDLKRYINKYGNDIGIIRDVEFIHNKTGVMRYTELTLFKKTSMQDLLYTALKPYLEREYNDNIISFDNYRLNKIQTVAI